MARSLGINKDLEPVARQCRKAGWTVEVTKGNHVRWAAPDGFVTITALTGSGRQTHIDRKRLLKHLQGAS